MELTKEFVNSCWRVAVLRDFLCQAIDQVDEKDKEIAELKAENEKPNNALDKERSETIKYMDELCNAKNEIERLTIDERNAELRADVADATVEKLKAENAQLKQKLQDQCISCPVKMQEDDVVAELKQKLEDVQASMYADVVDAGMENRRLKRSLWLARAEWARSSALSYHLIESHPDKDAAATYKRKANKWEKVKDKCLKKAEEYNV